jgi:hypothetical protein
VLRAVLLSRQNTEKLKERKGLVASLGANERYDFNKIVLL